MWTTSRAATSTKNEKSCKEQLGRLSLGEHGEVRIGPPTAEQATALAALHAAAVKVAADQEAMRDLRKVVVAFHAPFNSDPEYPGTSPIGGTGTHKDPYWFDPLRPPDHVDSLPGPDEGRPWVEVKKEHDRIDHLIDVRLMMNSSYRLETESDPTYLLDATQQRVMVNGHPVRLFGG